MKLDFTVIQNLRYPILLLLHHIEHPPNPELVEADSPVTPEFIIQNEKLLYNS